MYKRQVPLGSSTNVVFQFNNPLYVSLMRYTNSEGRSAGEITGKLPLGIAQGNNPEQIGHGNILYISNGSKVSGNHIEMCIRDSVTTSSTFQQQ